MLSSKGFDLWADGYEESVGLTDEDGSYPFAGYKSILGEIYHRVMSGSERTVLDIGFGTGTLTAKLYEQGCSIYGQDFSEKMLELAQGKMPQAKLYRGDFSLGLVDALKRNTYDAVIATYSLHHLTDTQKVSFLKSLLPLVNEHGHIYMGDVAFGSQAELDECRRQAGNEWDEEEYYLVFDALKESFPNMTFEPHSYCAGLLVLEK